MGIGPGWPRIGPYGKSPAGTTPAGYRLLPLSPCRRNSPFLQVKCLSPRCSNSPVTMGAVSARVIPRRVVLSVFEGIRGNRTEMQQTFKIFVDSIRILEASMDAGWNDCVCKRPGECRLRSPQFHNSRGVIKRLIIRQDSHDRGLRNKHIRTTEVLQ